MINLPRYGDGVTEHDIVRIIREHEAEVERLLQKRLDDMTRKLHD